jgi:hypothetical protein
MNRPLVLGIGVLGALGAVALWGTRAKAAPPLPKPPPGPGPLPPPVPVPTAPPILPQLPTDPPGWQLVQHGSVPSGRLRVAAAVSGFYIGGLPLWVDVLTSYYNLMLYLPVSSPDPDDWPLATEGTILVANPQFLPTDRVKWSDPTIVHFEGSYHGVSDPYEARWSTAQNGLFTPYGVWQKVG